MLDALSEYTSVSSRRRRHIHRPTEVIKIKDRIPKPIETQAVSESKSWRETTTTRKSKSKKWLPETIETK